MNRVLLLLGSLVALSWGPAGAEQTQWDQAQAKRMVAKVLEVEKAKTRPWNRIPWRVVPSEAAAEAKRAGKPLFVFLFVEQTGPPLERCCPEGRLLRTHALSDPTVHALVKSNFIPLKVALEEGKEFPLEWPALSKWATAYQFSNGKGFAGCAVVSADLQIEYGNSGSAKIWQLFASAAFDAKKFAAMLERAESRVTEERSLRVQRGINDFERKREIQRFRQGVTHAVRAESGSALPPKGYSLEQALELYRMAGAADTGREPPGEE